MPEISFYLLTAESSQDRYLFACKLVEKAYRSGCACYLLTDNNEQSRLLDDLLWTFRAGSFIPHQIYTGQVPDLLNIMLIGHLAAPEHWQQTLINLSAQCPESFLQMGRIVEILEQNETVRAAGRQRYRQYQQAGIKMTTYEI